MAKTSETERINLTVTNPSANNQQVAGSIQVTTPNDNATDVKVLLRHEGSDVEYGPIDAESGSGPRNWSFDAAGMNPGEANKYTILAIAVTVDANNQVTNLGSHARTGCWRA